MPASPHPLNCLLSAAFCSFCNPPPSLPLCPTTHDSNKWCGAWGRRSSGRPGRIKQGSKRNKGETAYDQWSLTKEWDRTLRHPLTSYPPYPELQTWSPFALFLRLFSLSDHKEGRTSELEDLAWLFPLSVCNLAMAARGCEKPFCQRVSWRDHTHSSAAAQRARLCKWEMTVLLCVEYQWSNYCFMLGYWPLRRAHAASVLHFSPASSQGRDEHCALESRANNGSTDTGLEEPRGPEPQTAKRWGGLKRAPQQRWND